MSAENGDGWLGAGAVLPSMRRKLDDASGIERRLARQHVLGAGIRIVTVHARPLVYVHDGG